MKSKETKGEVELLKLSGYSDRAIWLYLNRVNVGILEKPDIVETYVDPCGAVIRLYLAVDKYDVIKDAKFQSVGCPGVASSASAMTNLLKGKTTEEAKKITEEDLFHELKGLPDSKIDCIGLVLRASREAIANFEENQTQGPRVL